MQCVIDSVFFLLHFHFGCSTHIQNSHTACQLSQTLLQLLAIVVACCTFNLGLDLVDSGFDIILVAGTIDYGGVILVDGNFFCTAQIGQICIIQLIASLFRDNRTTGQNSDIFQHGLAAIPKAWGLHCSNFQGTADFVDHQSRQGLAVHIFRND